MKRLLTAIAGVILFASCSQYDDIAVWNKSIDVESRVAALEVLCKEVNTNVASLQTIVSAIQEGDYIKSVTPLEEQGDVIGYVITFAESGSVIIYHGRNGKDGENGKDGQDGKDGKDGEDGKDGKDMPIPEISVRKDVDGVYYWTLDGEWLTDESGNKIKAEGKDGADGSDGEPGLPGNDAVTPEFRIVDGCWEVSYDHGVNWLRLGKATGEDGKDGESFFSEVKDEDGKLVIILKDETVLEIPYSASLNIKFSQVKDIPIVVGKTVTVEYEVSGYGSDYDIEILCYDGWDAEVISRVASTGKIIISCPAFETERKKVAVFVSAEDGTAKMTTLTFKYEYVKGNNYIIYFSTDASVVTPFKSDVFGANILSNTYDGYGLITFDGDVCEIGDEAFYNRAKLKEVRLPDTVTSIGKSAFEGCSGLAGKLDFPSGITKIGDEAFSGCSGLVGDLIIPEPVKEIGEYAFYGCTGFKGILVLNSQVTEIGDEAFAAPVTSAAPVKLNFSKIYCKASVPPKISEPDSGSIIMSGHYFPWYSGTFGYVFPEYLAVPKGSKTAYSNAKGWKAFTTIEEVEF